ncbi:hypothetical protein BJ165DRAFT_1518733 [Panaeolus papilionaceus]|nr:hypothetical protein BJ165DRAFT_1518733 [Panaeolus papilionaceus]
MLFLMNLCPVIYLLAVLFHFQIIIYLFLPLPHCLPLFYLLLLLLDPTLLLFLPLHLTFRLLFIWYCAIVQSVSLHFLYLSRHLFLLLLLLMILYFLTPFIFDSSFSGKLRRRPRSVHRPSTDYDLSKPPSSFEEAILPTVGKEATTNQKPDGRYCRTP